MRKRIVRLGWLLAAIGGMIGPAKGEGPSGEAFVARLVHPDRQAQEVLRLFKGARWSNPAAALAAWKQRDPGIGLGKPAEALIAVFNPEMACEWRSVDGAEIRIGVDPASGEPGWFALIPREDGTLAAGITAMRLTYPDDRPIRVDGGEKPVARLGRSGVPLACQVGPAIVVASSRERLERGVALARAAGRPKSDGPGEPADHAGLPGDRDSGTVFLLEPARLSAMRGGTIGERRAIEALRALGCRRVEGHAALAAGTLRVEASSHFDGARPDGAGPRAVEMTWLEALPTAGVMAAFSLAIDPDPDSWARAFAAADRVERVDPARAGLAPLRTRINLLAMGAGWRLEADLRPHLRGLSAGFFGESSRPGRMTGALIGLHLDEPAIARRLAQQARPRLVALAGPDAGARAVTLRPVGRDLWIAWGDGARAVPGDAPVGPRTTIADLCGGWAAQGRPAPARVAALWPARVWQPAGVPGLAARVLAEDPPIVWWGWSEPGRAHDLVRWDGLDARVRGLLDALPVDGGTGARLPDSRIQD